MKKSIFESADVGLKKVGAILNIFALVAVLFSPILVSVPTASAATVAGPNNGTVFAGNIASPFGDTNWSNASRASSSNDQYASADLDSNDESEYLRVQGFNFGIPTDATINGIEVKVEKRAESSGNNITDYSVRLVKNGVISGDDKANTVSEWGNSDFISTYGGSSSLWGLSWSSSDINNANTGVVFAAQRGSGGGDREARVDHISMTVYYTPALASTTTNVNCPTVNFGSSTTCTATVTRVSGSNAPSGSVSFASNATGTFSASSCVLSGSGASTSCSVDYTPTAFNSGSQTITANYGGDSNFTTSSGNTALTINDVTSPVFGATPGITQEATSLSGAVVSFTISATDNVDGSVTPVCSPVSGATFAFGTTTVNCTATDSHSNSSTASFSVTVQDTTAPTITILGSNPLNLNVGDTYTESGASANDNIDGDITGSITTVGSVDTAVPAAYFIGYSVSDAHGNTANATRTVYVSDITAPTIIPVANQIVEATGPMGAVVNYGPVMATDDVDASSSLSVGCTPTSGSTFSLGTTTVNCTVTDSSTNTANAAGLTVTVLDTTPPTLTLNGAASTSLTIGDTYAELGATFMDLVDTSGTVVIAGDVVPAGVLTSTGVYTITYDATDSHGNAATQLTRTVTVSNPATTTLTISFGSMPTGYGASVTVNSTTATYTTPVVLNDTELFNATATPVIGYAVTSTGTCSGTATAGGPYVCEFNYVSSSFDITASAGSNGSISPAGVTSVPQGGDQTFTITPASGFQVSDVLVDGSSVGGVTTYTFSSVMASHTIAVSFSAIPPTPPSGGGGGGSVVLVPASNPSGGTTGGGTTGGATGGTTGTGTGTGVTDGGNVGGGVGGNVLGDEGAPTGGNNNPPVGGGGGANIDGLAGVIGGGGAEVGGGLVEGTAGVPTSTQLADLASSTGVQASLLASILDTLGGNMNLLILLIAIFGILGLIYYFSRD